MRPSSLCLVLLATAALSAGAADDHHPRLEDVAAFPDQQVTGIAVSKQGRIFVNFPYWSDTHKVSVAEVSPDGSLKPFPNDAWNAHDGTPDKRWVCVQSVYVDEHDALWVLDPAAPKMEAIVKGGPKLVKIDLGTNQVVQTIPFEEAIAPERSYLNDVRMDGDYAYITESGLGALIVVDLRSGKKRRVLANAPITKAEPGVELQVDEIKVVDPKTGKAPQINADGIALDRERGDLYFHALTGHTLYRVKTADLRNESLTENDLVQKVERLANTPAPDGMLEGRDQTVYLAAFEEDAIVRWEGKTGKVETVIKDQRLQWPDTMCWGADGAIYLTTSQIHRMPKYNNGQSKVQEPYRVFRLRLE